MAAAAVAGAGVVAACSSTRKRAGPTGVTAPSLVPTTAGPVPTAPAVARSGAPTPTAPATTVVHQGPAVYVASGRSSSTGVALTFHTAGDATVVESILDQAGRLGAKATFFVVGTWATA